MCIFCRAKMNSLSMLDRGLGPMLFLTSMALNFLFHGRIRMVSSMSLSSHPPKAKKIAEKIIFGAKEGENRGDKPMNPPRVRLDYYNWLRDNTRKDKQV